MFNPLKRFTTVAKVIVHGAFPLLASVWLLVCARIVLQATVYLPWTATTAAQEPPGLGKAAKAPAESRGKPVEGAAAAPKRHRRGLRIQIPLPPSGIPAAPSFQQQLLLEWR